MRPEEAALTVLLGCKQAVPCSLHLLESAKLIGLPLREPLLGSFTLPINGGIGNDLKVVRAGKCHMVFALTYTRCSVSILRVQFRDSRIACGVSRLERGIRWSYR